MLKRFDEAIIGVIRGLVSLPDEKGGALPRHLLSQLRFGDSGGGGSSRFLSGRAMDAKPIGGNWTFRGHCRRIRPDQDGWHVIGHLKFAVDGGGGDDVRAITEIAAEGATRAEVRNGVG